MRMSAGLGLLVLGLGLAGCGESGSPSALLAPSPGPAPTSQLVVFTDPTTGFRTSDVRDDQDHVVNFSIGNELIWTADGTRFPGYPAAGNFIGKDHYYGVRFATRQGERRAYFCGHGHDDVTDPPSICRIEVIGGQLVITETGALCPGVRE